MALSPIEDSYLQRLTSSQFPDMPASEPAMPVDAAALDAPSMDGMQLAAGPSQTVSDAGAGRGSYAGFDPRLDMANKGQQDQMRAYDPTTRERIASFLQAGFEGLGMDRYKARQNAQTLIGGGSSNLPLDMGLADIVPFLGTALQTEEAVNMGGEAVQSAKQGNYGTAALQAGGAVLGLVPGAVGTAKAAKGLKNLPVGMSTQAVGGVDGVLTQSGPSLKLPAAKKAEKIIKGIDPEEQTVLFHSGDASIDKKLKDGIEPGFGSWLDEVLSGAVDDPELAAQIRNQDPIAFYSETPDWVAMKVARVLKKPVGQVTEDDIRKHGQLSIVIVDKNDRSIWRENGKGEADQFQGQGRYTMREIPFGVERGDIFTTDAFVPEVTLTGDDLVEFLKKNAPEKNNLKAPAEKGTK